MLVMFLIAIIVVIILAIAVVDLFIINKSLRKQSYKTMQTALHDEARLRGEIQTLKNQLRGVQRR